ncbi:Lrp/AsnC family transcriptional regulator [Actinocrispum wychmicini]|uniref:DNA-binding Lrp family transcriptional regulator n=1 Tax=Actinocrispum wychmicini TaxID=1213861 RepID=A0A4R2JPM7_9PSEU|nr:Lrp/AsnC family transcriptional regulator [Actinocrispum wychmicini]TCO60937.1 DNA-binding Lrp family transcriptional regulator [Actinocrispum wychmicini]
MDQIDRAIIGHLQHDATTPYTALGDAVGLSAAAAHERVRKLRDNGVIRATTVDVDPALIGRDVLAYVQIEADEWMGGADTAEALRALPWIQEAHIIAGTASILVKVRATSTRDLQNALKRVYDIPGVTGTDTTVVLETFFERPVYPHD